MPRGVYKYLVEPMPCSRAEVLRFLGEAYREADIAARITKWITISLVIAAWVVFAGLRSYMFSSKPVLGVVLAALASIIAIFFGYGSYRNYRDFESFVSELTSMVEAGEIPVQALCKQQLGLMSPQDLDDLRRIGAALK
jgi:hypothetical protein